MKTFQKKAGASLVAVLLLVSGMSAQAAALVGPHSYTNTSTGDVFLGGDYIELGISKAGSFGTTNGQPLPPGFYGTTGGTNIGMSTNPTGFGVAPDLRMDFFLPGSPEEQWTVGYKTGGTATTGSNSLLEGPVDIADNTVTDQSSGDLLKATSEGTLGSTLQTTQVISFNRGDKFFKNDVTLKNVSSSPIDSVRFMRSFDPDNTVYQGGDYTTHNYIPYTNEAGDGKAVVVADTNVTGNSDPVYAQNGSYSPILFYSSDPRARVSTFGFDNEDPYDPSAYDSALPKGTDVDADQAITIAFDVGTLAPGASQTVSYYTSLDNRDFSEVLSTIQASSGAANGTNNIPKAVEDAAPNNGDGNGDGTPDSQQNDVASLPNPVAGSSAYQTVQVTDAASGCSTITHADIKPSSSYGADGSYLYPLGLTDYSVTCTTPGGTANVKIFYDKQYDTSHWVARKFINGKYTTLPGAVFGMATVGTQTVTTLSYSVTDGGPLDADGSANGTIVDPAGPAVLGAATAPNTGMKPVNKLLVIAPLLLGSSLIVLANWKLKVGKTSKNR